MGCPVQFFHNLDDTQPTTRLLKNATRFSRLSSWLTLQTNSQDEFPQDSTVLPTGINSDCYDERRHFVIFNGWQQITLRNYTELDTLQKIGTTRPFMPPTRPPDAARPRPHPPRPRTRRPPTPPFTAPPQKSHVIRLPENSTPPTNVAIPTVWFQSLKGLHGIMCDISGQPPRHPDDTRPTPRPRTRRPPTLSPRLAHTSLHRPTPKVARNSATRKFNTAHKRCNTNDLVSRFERFTWNYVRHFRATTPITGRCPPDTQASCPTTAHAQPTPRPRPHPPSPPHPKSRT